MDAGTIDRGPTMGEQDYIRAGEFGRFRADLQGSLGRLEDSIHAGFGDVSNKLDALNGRGRKNEQDVAVLAEQVKGVRSDLNEMDERAQAIDALASESYGKVTRIDKDGCGAVSRCLELAAGESPSPRIPLSGWLTEKRKTAALGVGAGAILLELIQLVAKVIERIWPVLPKG